MKMITESRIETTKGMCVIALTKHLMDKFRIDTEDAFTMLLQTQLYALLMDSDTRLFFEPNAYLCQACDREIDGSIDQLYDFINA